jgi:hypothetical protein
MSMRMMTQVWERSEHKGSELLLMLAIADNANDQGIAYPSTKTLAKKTRLDHRHTRRLLRILERSGELTISIGTGPHGCNEYRIALSTLSTGRGGKMPRGAISSGAYRTKRGGRPRPPNLILKPLLRSRANN